MIDSVAKISYKSDSQQGKTLSTEVNGEQFGWVEYCLEHGDLYHVKHLDADLQAQWRQQTIDAIKQAFVDGDHKYFGFLQHLCQTRQHEPFLFPVFATVDAQQPVLGAGLSRLAASICNGKSIDGLIVLTPKQFTAPFLNSAKPITSTQQFDTLFGFGQLDYEISLEEKTPKLPVFCRSVIRHSIYDKQDQALPHINLGVTVNNFWQRHVKNYGKITLEVHCTEQVAQLIQPSKLFHCNVILERAGEWEWNYGRLTGAYRKNDSPVKKTDLYLWLFDVQDPIDLELLIPWVQNSHTCFYSENKKSVLFDTTDVTSMQIIGDWVN